MALDHSHHSVGRRDDFTGRDAAVCEKDSVLRGAPCLRKLYLAALAIVLNLFDSRFHQRRRMPRRKFSRGIRFPRIDNARVIPQERVEIAYIAERDVIAACDNRRTRAPRNHPPVDARTDGGRYGRPYNWDSIQLIDHPDFLRSVEKGSEATLTARTPWIGAANGREAVSFYELRLDEHGWIIGACNPLDVGGIGRYGFRMWQMTEHEPRGLVRRRRPLSLFTADIRFRRHSSPMSHACSRSFFE